jgi:hypothetical protein
MREWKVPFGTSGHPCHSGTDPNPRRETQGTCQSNSFIHIKTRLLKEKANSISKREKAGEERRREGGRERDEQEH